MNSAGELFVSDTNHNQVLKVNPVTGLITVAAGDGTASYFGDNLPAPSAGLNQPGALAFDAAGNLFVSDADLSISSTTIPGRVLVFTPPFLPTSSIYAARIMGVVSASATTPPQSQVDRTVMINPQSVFALPNNQGIGVVDTQSNRILIFDPYTLWPDPSTSFSPQAKTIIGQPNSCVAYP